MEMSLTMAYAHTWLEAQVVKADVGEAEDAEVAAVVVAGAGVAAGVEGII